MTVKTPIVVENLSKAYVSRRRTSFWKSEKVTVNALDNVSFTIHAGEIFGLLGPNGAGKTTLIKCLTTLLLPTSGSARVNGFELGVDDTSVRASLGTMLMGERALYWKLTGEENLHYFAALYHVPRHRQKERVAELIEQFAMQDYVRRPVETYSSGQRMKLAFAKALINDAPIIILDEPTNTLDVPSAIQLRAIVQDLKQTAGKTFLYTTHVMPEAEALCDRVAIINDGKIVTTGTIPELKRQLNMHQSIRIKGQFPTQVIPRIEETAGVISASRNNNHSQDTLTIVVEDSQTVLPDIVQTLVACHARIQHIHTDEMTLEQVFLSYTGTDVNSHDRTQITSEATRAGVQE